MAIKDSYPAIRPSLDLNFAGSRMVDPRITFSRASSATYFDDKGVMRTALAGVPRIDHDPVTGECKGLLIEEQRTNLLTYSGQFDNAAWLKYSATVTANAAVAPDGTLTADKLVENTANSSHSVRATTTIADNTTYCLSVFVKAAEISNVVVVIVTKSAGVRGVGVNLNNGNIFTPTGISGPPSYYKVDSVGNGWYRVSVANDVLSGAVNENVRIFTSDGVGINYPGDGTSGIYIWGAQVEQGAFPTSYIPTTSATATRASEVTEITGTNFSDFHNPREFTLYAKYTLGDDASSLGILHLIGATSADTASVHYSASSAAQATLNTNGVNLVNISPTGYSNPGVYSRAFAVSGSSANQAINGVLPSGGFTGPFVMPALIKMQIGTEGSASQINGHIAKVAYYPKRLTDEQLQALTT